MVDKPDFNSRKDLEAWLRDKPPEWAQALAVRSALRVFPLVLSIAHVRVEILTSSDKHNLILQAFRAICISWAACKYPAHDMSASSAAAYASVSARAASAASASAASAIYVTRAAAASAVSASASAVYASRAFASAASAAAYAAGAPSASADAASAALSAALIEDTNFLVSAGNGRAAATQLIAMPLWIGELTESARYQTNSPEFARRAYDKFVNLGWVRGSSWELITDWYAAILPNGRRRRPKSLFGEKADIAIATQADDFWTVTDERSAERILDEIAEIAGWGLSTVKQTARETMREFIIRNLEEAGYPLSIDDFVGRFGNAGYRSSRQSIRGRLNELTDRGEILRVGRGIYAPLDREQADKNSDPAPEAIEQGSGPVFTATDGELSRLHSLPDAEERENPVLEKLHSRIKKRLEALVAALGNGIGRYPQLAEILDDYAESVSPETLADLDIDDLWISGTGLIAQARSFAALDPSKQVTEPLEPQQQALLGEIARLHGALVMGFAKGRELAEKSGIPLLTAEEFRQLLEHERAIVRWLLESDQFAMSDQVRSLFETVDHVLVSASENAEDLATTGYPVVRNLLIYTANALGYAEKTAGRLSLLGLPVHLAVGGTLIFLQNNLAPIMGFAASVPELQAYLEYHLRRLEIDWQAKSAGDKDGKHK